MRCACCRCIQQVHTLRLGGGISLGSFPDLLPVAFAAPFLPLDVVPDIGLFDIFEPTVLVPVTPTPAVLTDWDVVVLLLHSR